MPPTFLPDFFEQRKIGNDVIKKEEPLDENVYLDGSVDSIPPGCLIPDGNKWLVPAHTIMRDKWHRICQYNRPPENTQPFMRDSDTGCEYYLIEEACWKHYKIYLVFGPDEYLWFEFDADRSVRKKLLRFCPDGSVTDFGVFTEQTSFVPVGGSVDAGWVPPLEGSWIVAHGYGEKRYEEDDICVLVLYIYVRQEPIIIRDRIMIVKYKLMAKVEKRNCRTNALLSGYPRYEEVPGAPEATVHWRIGH
ncbi:MAG: hypothetical protein HY957_06595 [Nitrospirae bacterium]|nr:hypothetical protein [Nitrospirota bacterium]